MYTNMVSCQWFLPKSVYSVHGHAGHTCIWVCVCVFVWWVCVLTNNKSTLTTPYSPTHCASILTQQPSVGEKGVVPCTPLAYILQHHTWVYSMYVQLHPPTLPYAHIAAHYNECHSQDGSASTAMPGRSEVSPPAVVFQRALLHFSFTLFFDSADCSVLYKKERQAVHREARPSNIGLMPAWHEPHPSHWPIVTTVVQHSQHSSASLLERMACYSAWSSAWAWSSMRVMPFQPTRALLCATVHIAH